jgi:hypothetical protein
MRCTWRINSIATLVRRCDSRVRHVIAADWAVISRQQVARLAIGAASVEQLDARTYRIDYEAGGAVDVAIIASTLVAGRQK